MCPSLTSRSWTECSSQKHFWVAFPPDLRAVRPGHFGDNGLYTDANRGGHYATYPSAVRRGVREFMQHTCIHVDCSEQKLLTGLHDVLLTCTRSRGCVYKCTSCNMYTYMATCIRVAAFCGGAGVTFGLRKAWRLILGRLRVFWPVTHTVCRASVDTALLYMYYEYGGN